MTEPVIPAEPVLLVDDPAPRVRRLTLNRPEKRNPISNELRGRIHEELQLADRDPDVGVTVIRGAGDCFSSGYDIKSNLSEGRPFDTPGGVADWARHVTETWPRIWDLAKPVIAQVHGYAMAGATELMAACDLVYLADDATITYPVVRVLSPPDFQYPVWLLGFRGAMELMLTGGPLTAPEAVQLGMANRAFPAAQLEDEVLRIAQRIVTIPSDVLQINKRTVHRAMEVKGIRTATRAVTELNGLAMNLESTKALRGNAAAAIKDAAKR